MSDIAITERQQYWLDHIRAAAAFDGNLAEYARSAGLKPKELYSWKGILGSRGLLDEAATPRASGFVRVIAPARPSGVSLVLPNGVRLDCHGELGPEQLEAMILAASRLP